MKPIAIQTQRGFTLIELAIVLTIIGIVIGMSTEMTISVTATAHLTATQRKMKTINDALMQFRTATDRLPCPGDLTIAPGSANYGLEAGAGSGSAIAVGTGVCTGTGMLPAANHTAAGATNTGATGAEGALPAVTLGLPPDFMLDGWGNKIRYAVDIAYTDKGVFASVGVACTNGAITVKDASGNARSTASIYALISHGANGHGAYTPSGATVNAGSSSADELTNCHCTSASAYNSAYAPTYVQKAPAYDSGEAGVAAYYYDDLVSYKERWQMRTDWDKTNGCQYIYVTDTYNSRVQKFDSTGTTWLGSIGGTSSACTSCMCTGPSACPTNSGSGNGQFNYPEGIAIDTSGNLWVADGENDRVEEFSSSGNYLSQFSCNANGIGGFLFDLAFDSSGNVWVTDENDNRVLKYNSSGTFLLGIGASYQGVGGSIATSGTANGQFYTPEGIAVDSGNNVWVTDANNSRVQKFNSSGTWLLSIGGPSPHTCETSPAGSPPACASGSGNGQFTAPAAVAIDSGGNAWVMDYQNSNVQEFNSSGSYITQFTTYTSASHDEGPLALTIDSSGNFWMFNQGYNVVDKFNSSGSYVSPFGAAGTGNGQFQFGNFGIAISSR